MNINLDQVILHNPLKEYLITLLIFVGGIIFLNIFKKLFLGKIHQYARDRSEAFDRFLIKIIDNRTLPLLYIIILYFAVDRLKITNYIDKIIDFLLMTTAVFFITLLAQEIVIFSVKRYWNKREQTAQKAKLLQIMTTFIRIFSWILALIFILDNLNLHLTGLLTGLGVGGIAIAFAAQAMLSDIFSYFTIFLDRPFDIGDFIIIGDHRGTVENIGIKTTRIRSLSGEQLVFPNTDLTNSRISNYKRMEQRRINFSFGVIYGTELEKLKKIPLIVENVINSIDQTLFDRAHFAEYGDYSLIYQVVYYVLSNDYKLYMDIQQEINFKLNETFSQEGIEFAYPSQSLYLHLPEQDEENNRFPGVVSPEE